MRNLFLGYFHTPRTKRAEVLRLMGNVVGLDSDDVGKVSGRVLLFSRCSRPRFLPHLVRILFLNPLHLNPLVFFHVCLACVPSLPVRLLHSAGAKYKAFSTLVLNSQWYSSSTRTVMSVLFLSCDAKPERPTRRLCWTAHFSHANQFPLHEPEVLLCRDIWLVLFLSRPTFFCAQFARFHVLTKSPALFRLERDGV